MEVSSQQTTAKRLNDTTTASGCELGIPLSDQEIPAVQSSIRSPSLLKELRCTFCLKIDEGVSNSLSMSSIHRQVEEILEQLQVWSHFSETAKLLRASWRVHVDPKGAGWNFTHFHVKEGLQEFHPEKIPQDHLDPGRLHSPWIYSTKNAPTFKQISVDTSKSWWNGIGVLGMRSIPPTIPQK